jgi:hypothetical protein
VVEELVDDEVKTGHEWGKATIKSRKTRGRHGKTQCGMIDVTPLVEKGKNPEEEG